MDPFRYSPDREARPEEPFYDVEFQSSLTNAQDSLQMFETAYKRYLFQMDLVYTNFSKNQTDSRISNVQSKELSASLAILDKAMVLGSSDNFFRAIMLYFVAPSHSAIFRNTKLIQWTGKSSLINALLHTEGLALTDASGTAVTAFPTEYRYREERQEAKYVIEAECYNDSEMDDHIQELLDEYRKPYMASAHELSEVEYKEAEDKSHAAKQVFETVFGNTEMFFHGTGEHPSDLDLKKMKDESEGAYDRILAQLQHLSQTLKWPEMANGLWQEKTASAEKVSELLQPWIESGLWAFVKIARIYLESDLLKSGIILADLPGYHDVNFARMRAAKGYQATCEEIFVISDIKRAIDDPVIQDVITDHCRRFTDVGQLTRPRITVVCTHSGDNGDMKDLEKHVSKDLLDVVKEEQKRLSNNRDNLSVAEWMKACAEVDIKYNTLLFTSRNERVDTQLKARYAADFKEYNLAVFCVDNRDYHTCRNEQEAILSGIPNLRMFCYEIPARAQFKSAHHYIWTELPSLISSIKLWIEASRSPVKQKLAEIVSAESLFSDLDEIETAWREVIGNAFAGMLSNYDEKMREIIERAVATCECWGEMHHSSYRAFIRKNGTHQTKICGKRNWNRELNENANKVLAHDWMSLDEQIATGIQRYLKRVKKSMDKIIASAIDTMAPHEFIENMRGRQTRLHFELDIEFGEFRTDLGVIKRNACSGDEASYVATWMRVVYRECALNHGAGVTARNRERILEHVTSGLFDELFRKINTNLDELALKHLNSVATIRGEIYDAIDADISVMTAPDTAVFEEHPEFGRRVVEMLSTAKTSLELLQHAAAGTVAWAHQRGYIQNV